MAKHSSTPQPFWELLGITPTADYGKPTPTHQMLVDVQADYTINTPWWSLVRFDELDYQKSVWAVWQDGDTPHWRQLEA